jgi:hypothetical protein
MRALAKSLNSFSWAMSLFGAQQAWNLLRRPFPGGGHPANDQLGTVARAGELQLTGVFRRTFDAGDQLQRSAVDLAFGVLTLQALDPNRFTALSADLLRQSTAVLRSMLPGGGAAPAAPAGSAGSAATACGCGQPCGWGPMPPAK